MIGNLSKYADEHFALEERYMEESNYPGLDNQKREHKYFIVKLLSLEAEGHDSPAAYAEVINFLMSWLINHVRQTDMQLKNHLRP
jgi:hemerythrin